MNLDAARIVDDSNWYMSEFGFFDQQKEAVVHFGIAPCVILQHNATAIECIASDREAWLKPLNLSVAVHGRGIAEGGGGGRVNQIQYDAFFHSIFPREGSTEGGTDIQVTGSFGAYPDGFRIPGEWFTNKRQHKVSVKLCSEAQPCTNYFEGYYRNGGHDCAVTGISSDSVACTTSPTTSPGGGKAVIDDNGLVVEYMFMPFGIRCKHGIGAGCNFTYR